MKRKQQPPKQRSQHSININLPTNPLSNHQLNSKSLNPYVSSTQYLSSTNQCQYYVEDHQQQLEQLKEIIHQLQEDIVTKDKQIRQKNNKIEELLGKVEYNTNIVTQLRDQVTKLSGLAQENQFLTNNNKNLYKSTMRLNEQNHRLSQEIGKLQKKINQLEESAKKYDSNISEIKKSHKNLLIERKNIINQNQKDIKELELIKGRFQFQKQTLLEHIKYLQRVPKMESKSRRQSTRMIETQATDNLQKHLKSQIQNIKSCINNGSQQTCKKGMSSTKKRRGYSCV